MTILFDDASFQEKFDGVVAMVRSGMSAMDALLTENILGAWAMDDNVRYGKIVDAGHSTSMKLLEPFWRLLEQSGISLSEENKSVLYEDFWDYPC